MSYSLAAGKRGLEGFLQGVLHTYEKTWSDLAAWSQLDPEKQHKLVHAIDKAYKEAIVKIRPARDRRLAGILRGLEQSKHSQADRQVGMPNDGSNPGEQ